MNQVFKRITPEGSVDSLFGRSPCKLSFGEVRTNPCKKTVDNSPKAHCLILRLRSLRVIESFLVQSCLPSMDRRNVKRSESRDEDL
jgi:hypothetical protein